MKTLLMGKTIPSMARPAFVTYPNNPCYPFYWPPPTTYIPPWYPYVEPIPASRPAQLVEPPKEARLEEQPPPRPESSANPRTMSQVQGGYPVRVINPATGAVQMGYAQAPLTSPTAFMPVFAGYSGFSPYGRYY